MNGQPPAIVEDLLTSSTQLVERAYRIAARACFDLPARHQRISRDYFRILISTAPEELLSLLKGPSLAAAELTFAAEIAGDIPDTNAVVPALTALLNHTSALVREGAIYGLAKHATSDVIGLLKAISQDDPSPGVRAAALDVISE